MRSGQTCGSPSTPSTASRCSTSPRRCWCSARSAARASPTGWDPAVWTEDGRGVRTAEGLRVEDVAGPEAVDDADLVVLPVVADRPAPRPTTTLIGAAPRARTAGAAASPACASGAFPVVDSGLLDGRRRRHPLGRRRRPRAPAPRGDGQRRRPLPRPRRRPHLRRHRLGHRRLPPHRALATSAPPPPRPSRATSSSRRTATATRRSTSSRPMPEPGGVGHLGPTIDWALAHLDQPTLGRRPRRPRRG